MADLKLYNTLTRTKQVFVPEDEKNVRMYVCGPTVYDFAHIGNARPVIVFDVLYRLLRHRYGEEHVTYVRNITDVDDKINARAKRDYPDLPLNEAIRNVTEKTANQFHADVKALGCLEPTHEPRATEHIDGMISIIQTLLEKGHAYVADGGQGKEVLFRVSSMENYGTLSNRAGKLNEQQEGARVAVESHKENAGDFVLWKQSKDDEPGWSGEFNGETIHGRPGWHIECSAMSEAFLGKTFDIHGGGLDLIFPHHENEIAQSCCAHGTGKMASVWMHNGYVQVEGKKMSKSDGNFVTIRENLRGKFPGWNGGDWHGLVLRMSMLRTHYRQSIDWKLERFLRDRSSYSYWITLVRNWLQREFLNPPSIDAIVQEANPYKDVVRALSDDLNTSEALSFLEKKAKANLGDDEVPDFISSLNLLGLINDRALFSNTTVISSMSGGDESSQAMMMAHGIGIAKANNDIQQESIILDGLNTIGWKLKNLDMFSIEIEPISGGVDIQEYVNRRLQLLNNKNFAEADRIRDELSEQGIQLKDGKDPETGERVTTWEVKR